ncbi:MAG TPA: pilus assembly protein PilM [Myxococcales bacterium LLY-WYZ-16_1]|jgi:general secretion pathway protein L|nr:pilus assembly protein PilM [Myxococcales bacterium LLY-WYZ-16_1]
MPQRIVGVDVGSWSVKAVVVESSFRTFKVVGAKEVPLPPPDPELDEEERERARAQAALDTIADDAELKADLMVAAVPGNAAATRWITLPFADPRKVDQVIEGELADMLPFDIEDAVMDHLIVRKTASSSTTMTAAVPVDRLREVLSLFRDTGLEPRFMPLDVFQMSVLHGHYLTEDGTAPELPQQPAEEAQTFIQPTVEGPPPARLIVDVGHRRTTVTVVNEDGIHNTRVLRTGGADLTAAIAAEFQVSWEEAETGKHEQGFVASSRHPAPDDDHQRISDAIQRGARTLLQELRRTLQILRKERIVTPERLDLLGGGSMVRNFAHFLADQLNLPVSRAVVVEQAVERMVEPPRRPAFALALALALRQTGGLSPKIDFRVGEFAYAGQLEFLRQRLPTMVASVGALLFLLLVGVAVEYRGVIRREALVDAQFCAVTKEVVGREICEPQLAISVMQRPDSELGSFQLPERSAFVTAAELSDRVPEEAKIRLESLEVNDNVARVSGSADSFDSVDQLVGSYSESECLDDIEKSKISKSSLGDGVDFQLNIEVTCS